MIKILAGPAPVTKVRRIMRDHPDASLVEVVRIAAAEAKVERRKAEREAG